MFHILKDRQHFCAIFRGVISQFYNQEGLPFPVQRKKEKNSVEI